MEQHSGSIHTLLIALQTFASLQDHALVGRRPNSSTSSTPKLLTRYQIVLKSSYKTYLKGKMTDWNFQVLMEVQEQRKYIPYAGYSPNWPNVIQGKPGA